MLGNLNNGNFRLGELPKHLFLFLHICKKLGGGGKNWDITV